MANIQIPIRYYKDYPGGYDYGYETLTLEVRRVRLSVGGCRWALAQSND